MINYTLCTWHIQYTVLWLLEDSAITLCTPKLKPIIKATSKAWRVSLQTDVRNVAIYRKNHHSVGELRPGAFRRWHSLLESVNFSMKVISEAVLNDHVPHMLIILRPRNQIMRKNFCNLHVALAARKTQSYWTRLHGEGHRLITLSRILLQKFVHVKTSMMLISYQYEL